MGPGRRTDSSRTCGSLGTSRGGRPPTETDGPLGLGAPFPAPLVGPGRRTDSSRTCGSLGTSWGGRPPTETDGPIGLGAQFPAPLVGPGRRTDPSPTSGWLGTSGGGLGVPFAAALGGLSLSVMGGPRA
ncbi:hypothetical protein SBRY_20370 [Actinacidiphila bryophytorum]|uniref:Uncharacterized protein n=1 Tax=Actinacidiphila bryophytorum TaxID=1436133 RepID=A0A9W4GZC2_9ACTN|nr:hypothetical protein SBRY_20370 [Actinacidiphila bryophytorum]